MKKLFIILFCTILLMPNIVKADELKLGENAKSAILLEASTGQILFEKNSHEKLSPASMTNVMDIKL